MHGQPGLVGVVDEARRRQRAAVGVARDDVVLRRADGVGVARDLRQARGRGEVGPRARVAGDREVVRARAPGAPSSCTSGTSSVRVERLQVADLERLHEHERAALVQVVVVERAHERLLERQADRAEVRRVLGLGIDADRAAQLVRQALGEVDHLLERGHLEAAVVDRVALADLRDPLLRAQRLELGEREVLGEPAGGRRAVDLLGRAAGGELGPVGDVGRRGDVVLVAGDEHAVLGRHQVGLDVVGAHPRGERVARERVLGPVAGGAPVTDHDHRGGTIGERQRQLRWVGERGHRA